MSETTLTKAEQAVVHVLKTLTQNGDAMYHLGWGTQSFSLLTEAAAEATGKTRKEIEDEISENARPRQFRPESILEDIIERAGEKTPDPEERKKLFEELKERLQEAIYNVIA